VMNKKVQTPMPFALPVSLRPFHRVTGLDHWAASPPPRVASCAVCLPACLAKGEGGGAVFAARARRGMAIFKCVTLRRRSLSPPHETPVFFSCF